MNSIQVRKLQRINQLILYIVTKSKPNRNILNLYNKLISKVKTEAVLMQKLIISRDITTKQLLNNNKVRAIDFLKNPEQYGSKNTYEYNPHTTELHKINSDRNLIIEKIKSMLKNGRVRVQTKKELSKHPLGSLVSYLTKDGKYRSGGFLRSIQKDYFALQGGISSNPISFCVRFDNIRMMYVGSPVQLTNRKLTKTNFPVKINGKIVYYAKDNYDVNRFKNTQRYKRMKQYGKNKK